MCGGGRILHFEVVTLVTHNEWASGTGACVCGQEQYNTRNYTWPEHRTAWGCLCSVKELGMLCIVVEQCGSCLVAFV
jgi:hypothetical protein